MAIDWASLAAHGGFAKGTPRVIEKATKDRAEDRAWEKTKAEVDARDKKRCFVTGKPVTADAVDRWDRIERHHLEYRSASKARRYVAENVITTSYAVSRLIHSGALRILNKRGLPAHSIDTIDSVQWNRNMVPKGDEPCRIRKGLAVSEKAAA